VHLIEVEKAEFDANKKSDPMPIALLPPFDGVDVSVDTTGGELTPDILALLSDDSDDGFEPVSEDELDEFAAHIRGN
jgi:hypothetical protein